MCRYLEARGDAGGWGYTPVAVDLVFLGWPEKCTRRNQTNHRDMGPNLSERATDQSLPFPVGRWGT